MERIPEKSYGDVVKEDREKSRANGEKLLELKNKYKLDQVVAYLNDEVSRKGGVTEDERVEHRVISWKITSNELLDIKGLATEALAKIEAYEEELAKIVKPLVPTTERDSTVVAQRKHIEKMLEEVEKRISEHERAKNDLR